MAVKTILLLIPLLISAFNCEKQIQSTTKSFELTMERRNAVGPCGTYAINIESDGKVLGARNCLVFTECDGQFNGTSFEKVRCPQDEAEKIEKQLSEEEIKGLIDKVNSSDFFSFKDDYSFNSESCSRITTDMPKVLLTVKINQKKKTIEHYYGCEIDNVVESKNGLQPLIDLENEINRTTGIENWARGAK